MKRSRLRRSSPDKLVAWRRRSKRLTTTVKRSTELADARDVVIARSGGWCEANVDACPPYRHRGEHAHHRLARAQGGGHTPDNLAWLCAAAHRFVHEHPVQAHARGLILWHGDQ